MGAVVLLLKQHGFWTWELSLVLWDRFFQSRPHSSLFLFPFFSLTSPSLSLVDSLWDYEGYLIFWSLAVDALQIIINIIF